jgi:hypothetical protein
MTMCDHIQFENTGSNHKTQTDCSSPLIIQHHLAPSYFHLFEALKNAICGKRLESNKEVIEEIKKWLQVQNSNWYNKGIYALIFC